MSSAHPDYSQPMTLGLSTKGHLSPCHHRGLPGLVPGCPSLVTAGQEI